MAIKPTFDDFSVELIESQIVKKGHIKVKLSESHVQVVSVLGSARTSFELKAWVEIFMIEDVCLAPLWVIHVVSLRVPINREEGKTGEISVSTRPVNKDICNC